jgi:hypothetical protein
LARRVTTGGLSQHAWAWVTPELTSPCPIVKFHGIRSRFSDQFPAGGSDMALSIDPDAESQIEEELKDGEQLLWAGRPRQGIVFQASDFFVIPFSLLWGGFAILWQTMAILLGAPLLFVLFGTPFVLIGLYMIVGRFWFDAKRRSQTWYGVTNERVIILCNFWRRSLKSLDLATLSDVSLAETSHGSGTISFGPSKPGDAEVQHTFPALESIAEARSVFNIIRDTQRNASQDC